MGDHLFAISAAVSVRQDSEGRKHAQAPDVRGTQAREISCPGISLCPTTRRTACCAHSIRTASLDSELMSLACLHGGAQAALNDMLRCSAPECTDVVIGSSWLFAPMSVQPSWRGIQLYEQFRVYGMHKGMSDATPWVIMYEMGRTQCVAAEFVSRGARFRSSMELLNQVRMLYF